MNPFRKALLGGALVATTLTGGAIGAGLMGTAGAQSATTTPAASSAPAATQNGGNNSTDNNGTNSTRNNSTRNNSTDNATDSNGSGKGNGAGDSTRPNKTPDWAKGGHQANDKTETVLTGDDLAKAKAAAEAAVPGGTAQRAETDAEGAAYEVHMTKSDGSIVTVKLDNSFTVTETIDGMG